MTVIEMARELGKKIQQEESYIALSNAQRAVEEDDELQEKIAEFNMKRYELTQEITKSERDDKKIEELDKVVHELYDVATNHEKMVAYNDAQDEFNEMFEYVLHIIQMSATGDDPDTIARPEQGGCSGDCSSCGGCG
ncbi:MAG: YlbF family regulator [Oscillospiraceae bacterium]|nr:YlbF family regulator [Oscillospiraceae bacterium]